MYLNGKIPSEIMQKLNNAINSLGKLDNTVPASLKRTFNFKGRKSVDIAYQVISNLTDSTGTIFDPFTGSGSFILAGAKNGSSVVGCELDNYTFDAVRILIQKCDYQLLHELFTRVRVNCFTKIMDMYATECCGTKNFIDKLHFDPETNEYINPSPHRDIEDGKTIIMIESCPICGSRRKVFERIDEEKIIEANSYDTSLFPNHYLIENSRINITSSSSANKYDRNFTNRAKACLLILQKSINELPDCLERDILEHCLVASLPLARISQYGSGTEYIYQVMRLQAQEKNVWSIFESKYNAFRKFKEEFAYVQVDNVIENDKNLKLFNTDYKEILSKIEYQEAFDLIYTDPPYTDQVPFLERSQLFRDWLYKFYDNKFTLSTEMLQNEIVVTNAPNRESKHNYEQYYDSIDIMFSLFYKSLKKDGIVALTIKLGANKYLKTLAEFINLSRKNGFEFAVRFGIDKDDPSLRKQAAYKNTLSKEIIICFVKLDEESRYWYIGHTNFEHEIVKLLYSKLKSASIGLPLPECIKFIQNHLLRKYSIISERQTLEKIQRVIKTEFYVTTNSYVSINPDRLYLGVEDSIDLFAKLYDIIPVIIKSFNKEYGFSLDDLYFEIFTTLLNGDSNILEQIISNPAYEAQIKNLLDNYCDSNDNQYFLKRWDNIYNIEARDISSMDGYEFEELIKRLLLKEGYTDVVRVGGACDRGVDLIAKKVIDGEQVGTIFQCKRWLSNVGSTPIQRLHSMKIQLSPTIFKAVCITTSNYTVHAEAEANNTGVELINGAELIERLNQAFPGEYYHAALEFKKE
jgi:DNA modification methylase